MAMSIQSFRYRITMRLLHACDRWVNDPWSRDPMCSAPAAPPDEYLRLAAAARQEYFPDIAAFEHECGLAIDAGWLANLALRTQIVRKPTKLCYAHGRVLYSALSAYLRSHRSEGPSDRVNVVETGTARGFSAVCMAKALHDAGRPGTVLTFDLLPHLRPILWNCIADHEGRRTRRDLLAEWRELVDRYVIFIEGDTRLTVSRAHCGRVHFAFLDAGHSYEDVWAEFEHVSRFQTPGDIVVFDDYSPASFPGVVRAIDEICQTRQYAQRVLKSDPGRGYVVATKQ